MKYKKGFSLLETIVSLGFVLTTLSFTLICLTKVNNTKNLYKMHYQQLLHTYDIIQIIKSDHYFYKNLGKYYDISLIEFDESAPDKKAYIYFGQDNQQCDSSYYKIKLLLSYTETKNNKFYHHYYIITKYLKNEKYLDTREGDIIYVTVLSKI